MFADAYASAACVCPVNRCHFCAAMWSSVGIKPILGRSNRLPRSVLEPNVCSYICLTCTGLPSKPVSLLGGHVVVAWYKNNFGEIQSPAALPIGTSCLQLHMPQLRVFAQ
jgi:hypothetical protein